MLIGALRVQCEPLNHSSADLRRANETLARIHNIAVYYYCYCPEFLRLLHACAKTAFITARIIALLDYYD